MQAISTALNQLVEGGSWFVRAKEVRLFVVRFDADLRKAALRTLAGLEFHHDNHSPWMLMEDAHLAANPGWRARAERLLTLWQDRRAAFREREGSEMPAADGYVALPGDSCGGSCTAPMRQACAAVLAVLRPPLDGLVVVLAPGVLENADDFEVEIEALVTDPQLAGCRWVWLLDAARPWPTLLERLKDRTLACECVVDPERQKADVAAILAAPSGSIGRARPRNAAPPRRVDDPRPLTAADEAEALRAVGLEPAYVAQAPELQRLILGAAVAMKEGQGERAVQLQREAQNLAVALGQLPLSVLCRIALGSYLSGIGRHEEALAEVGEAIRASRGAGQNLLEAQARLAAGLLFALRRSLPEAVIQYAAAARSAEAANAPILAIEAWRMAGQVSLQAREEPRAAQFFREALRVAEASGAREAEGSSAGEVARALAALYARINLPQQAEALYAQADAIERGNVGVHPRPLETG